MAHTSSHPLPDARVVRHRLSASGTENGTILVPCCAIAPEQNERERTLSFFIHGVTGRASARVMTTWPHASTGWSSAFAKMQDPFPAASSNLHPWTTSALAGAVGTLFDRNAHVIATVTAKRTTIVAAIVPKRRRRERGAAICVLATGRPQPIQATAASEMLRPQSEHCIKAITAPLSSSSERTTGRRALSSRACANSRAASSTEPR